MQNIHTYRRQRAYYARRLGNLLRQRDPAPPPAEHRRKVREFLALIGMSLPPEQQFPTAQ